MEPVRLSLKNFLSYHDESIDFNGITCAALTGENGAGKSSLLDAITWALFGQGTRGRDLDDYVTRGEGECLVELLFGLGDNLYRVVRGRSRLRSKSTLEFFIQDGSDWRALSAKAITDTQALIEQTLRMDYRTFTASALILQGQADSFTTNLTDSERKEVLAQILGLDMWDTLQERAREKVRELKASLQAFDAQRQRLQTTVDQAAGLADRQTALSRDLTEAERAVETLADCITDLEVRLRQRPALEQSLAEIRRAMQQAQDEQRNNRGRQDQTNQQIAQCDSQIAVTQKILEHRDEIEAAVAAETEIAADVAELDQKALEYTRITDEIAKIERRKAALDSDARARIARLEAEREAVQRQATVIDQVPCTGDAREGCPLLAGARQASARSAAIESELSAARALNNPHEAALEEVRAERNALQYDSTAHQAAREALAEVQKTARLKPQLDAADQRVSELQARIGELQQNLAELAEQENRLSERLTELGDKERTTKADLEALNPLTIEFEAKRRRVTEERKREADLRTELGRAEQQLVTAAAAEEDLAQINAESQTLRQRLTVLDMLDQACGKKSGVPALIVENAVPELERLANEMLSRMAGGRLQVRLDTQAETKAGTVQEVLRIIVLEGGFERPYQTYSGAERFLVDLALRVALSKFLSHRAGAEIRLFVLDEGIGCADDVNRQAILDAILAVSDEFGKTLVVTHLNELKDAFPQRIEVEKSADGSKVRVA